MDTLYEDCLKIFGDIFESLIGAVFIDSQSISVTGTVLEGLLSPYIATYASLDHMQDHSRTKLLELWNSRNFTKNMKLCHVTEGSQDDKFLTFKGLA